MATTESLQAVYSAIELNSRKDTDRVKQVNLPPISSPEFPDSVPFQMQSVVVRGDRAYFSAFGATPERPDDVVVDGRPLFRFETSVQAVVSVVDLNTDTVIESESANLGVGRVLNGVFDIAFSPASDIGAAFVSFDDSIARFDMYEERSQCPIDPSGVHRDLWEQPTRTRVPSEWKWIYTVNFSSAISAS